MTNARCLLLSGCCDPSPFSSEAENFSAWRYFWKLRRHLCCLAVGGNTLHWAQVTVNIKAARFLKNISALAFWGLSKQQWHLGTPASRLHLSRERTGGKAGETERQEAVCGWQRFLRRLLNGIQCSFGILGFPSRPLSVFHGQGKLS